MSYFSHHFQSIYRSIAPLLLSAVFFGCAASDGGFAPGPGVSQGGGQDFGQFRKILEEGGIPAPETLDDVGFFSEHKIILPAATCEQDVCLHGLFGRMGNMITGSDCVTVLVGMNTPIDINSIERPPLNLAIAIDTSGSMQGDNIEYSRQGLLKMLEALTPQDHVSLITFSDNAKVHSEFVTGSDPQLAEAIDALQAQGSTNIYDGLRTAFELVEKHRQEGGQNRVILLSDGLATTGITHNAKIIHMAEQWGEQGMALTTIGMGSEFDVELMRNLSEVGSGSFYFLEDPSAVGEVFGEEVESFLVPLAEDVEINAQFTDSYVLRGIYGTHRFSLQGNEGHIQIPSLQLAHRTQPNDHEGGRRGGGGGILLELLPSQEALQAGTEGFAVGSLDLRYRKPGSNEYVEQQVEITSPLALHDQNRFFADQSVEKAFVMLNIYAGFKMATSRAAAGDDNGAMNILSSLATNVDQWLVTHPDADIEDDLVYVRLFIDNLVARGATEPPPSQTDPEPWPQD